MESLKITSYESATGCLDHLRNAHRALKRLDDEEGPEALRTLWPWRCRRDKLNSTDLLVVRLIAARIATLLVAAHREIRKAESLGAEMSPAPIRSLAVQFGCWCRAVATPGGLSAKEAGMRGIEFLFDGDKEVKRLKEELTLRILTLNQQVQIRGYDRRRWPLRIHSDEQVGPSTSSGVSTANTEGSAPKNKGGRPPTPGLLERYLEIERTAESLGMTWQEACDAYKRQYGIKVAPGTVQRWLHRYRRRSPNTKVA